LQDVSSSFASSPSQPRKELADHPEPAPFCEGPPSFTFRVDIFEQLGSSEPMKIHPTYGGLMARGRAKSTGRTVKPAGVTFESGVLEYLEFLGEREDRSRSWLINQMVKAHAMKEGIDIRTFASKPAQQMD
jgi:hypothetical protein